MSTSSLLSYAGWYILPSLATSLLQSTLYTIFIRAGDPRPAPGSPRHNRDKKRIHAFVIIAYLLYTLYEAHYQLRREGDFYSILGLPIMATEKEIQSRFRRLTVQYHPDKAAPGTDRAAIEAVYVHLKLARDVLVDGARRFAYDRFGPEILQWRSCKTIRDFVFAGMQNTSIYYGITSSVLVLMGVLGYLREGMFWRYLVMAGLFVVELYTVTRPYPPAILSKVVNPVLTATGLRRPYLQFQMIALLRKLAVTIFIALSQLGPILRDQTQTTSSSNGDTVPPQLIERLEFLAQTTDQELARLMGLELTPFVDGGGDGMKGLRSSVKDWLVHNTVRNDPEVKRAMGTVLERRRHEGGSGPGGSGEGGGVGDVVG
jgi:hypothetical protein